MNSVARILKSTLNTSCRSRYIKSLRAVSSDSKNSDITDAEDEINILAKEFSKNDMPIDGMVNPYTRKKSVCVLCKYGIKLNYKNPKLLSQFVSPYTGQLYGSHITRLCKEQQKRVKEEIQKSIRAGFMPSMLKSVEFLKDPMLFDPNNPVRPHKY
ncbi:UNVERIFIED_CONTAM: hypothetical protein RMT77_000009 [Armadillidium vulgare]